MCVCVSLSLGGEDDPMAGLGSEKQEEDEQPWKVLEFYSGIGGMVMPYRRGKNEKGERSKLKWVP